jgi:toxin FitB
MRFLLDTCVISETVKPRPDKRVQRWMRQREEASWYLSVLTLGEIRRGVLQMPESKRKTFLREWIDRVLPRDFEGRILPVTEEVAQTWGQIQAAAHSEGKLMPAVDSLIAATALTHNLVMVTRNVQDMEASGIEIINPWQ